MKENSLQQQSLGEFLRAIRERLTPEQVGLPPIGRRRTPGLRREEVAYLANVGVSWYTSIEQGKDVHPSHQVLESLASALKLSGDERRYLFLLAANAEDVGEEEIYDEVSVGLERTVFALEPHPTYILGRYWDILIWNRAAEFLFRFPPYSENALPKLNLMQHFIIDRSRKDSSTEWEERAKIMVARFRADCALYPQDEKLNEMVEKFKQESEFFNKWWPHYEVKSVTDCHKVHDDPRLGKLEFDHISMQLSNSPDMKLMVYTAVPATAQKLQQEIFSYS